jgi:hypothetical protein
MANQESSELTEPCVGALDDPAALVSSQLPAILVLAQFVVGPVRHDQLDAAPGEPLAQRIGVVGAVCDHALGLLSRSAFRAGDFDLGERGFRKRNFSRGGTFQPNSQWKTLAVDQYHPLRSLAPLGFPNGRAPFFAGAKLPSRNVSSHRNRPSPSSAPSSARQASSHTSCSSHCLSLRQQVAGEGYFSGRKRHAEPVRSTHKMPSRQPRLEAHGRPRLSLRRFGSGSSGLNQIPLRLGQQFKPLLAHATTSTNRPPHTKVHSLRPNLFMKQALVSSIAAQGARRPKQDRWFSHAR